LIIFYAISNIDTYYFHQPMDHTVLHHLEAAIPGDDETQIGH